MHGKVSTMTNLGSRIFSGIPKKFYATRYHSLVIQNNTLPNDFKIISDTIDNGKKVIILLYFIFFVDNFSLIIRIILIPRRNIKNSLMNKLKMYI